MQQANAHVSKHIIEKKVKGKVAEDSDDYDSGKRQQQRMYLRHLIKNRRKRKDSNERIIKPVVNQNQFLSQENPHLLEDNVLFLVLIGKRNFHTYLISDQEASRCRAAFKTLLANHPDDDCHEACFGLAKIYYHLNRLDRAHDFIAKACRMRPRDKVYSLWNSLIAFYRVSFGNLSSVNDPKELPSLKKQMQDCYSTLAAGLEVAPDSLATLFMLLKLCAYAERYEQTRFQGLRFKRKARDFALRIKNADEYMGYLAWAEIYVSLPEKRDLGI